jgi:hypothetical protein
VIAEVRLGVDALKLRGLGFSVITEMCRGMAGRGRSVTVGVS